MFDKALYTAFENGWTSEERRQNEKTLRKLDKINSTSKVILYAEKTGVGQDDQFTRAAKRRVQRMMHYEVSLKMFNAKVQKGYPNEHDPVAMTHDNDNEDHLEVERMSFDDDVSNFVNDLDSDAKTWSRHVTTSPVEFQTDPLEISELDISLESADSPESESKSKSHTSAATATSTDDSNSDSNTPFMCTPQSFPPTPAARAYVLERSTLFAENVLFLARDQLRISKIESPANSDQKQFVNDDVCINRADLALNSVFNANDTSSDLMLTRGQHCASKGFYHAR